MTDIVDRLLAEGEDAFSKHYSLGMWKLCLEEAEEIKRLREELAAPIRTMTYEEFQDFIASARRQAEERQRSDTVSPLAKP
jgi:hypothetical protein